MSPTAEEARQRHRPHRIKVLFIGESPPSGGTFFYLRNSRLYRETAAAFRAAVPDLVSDEFLTSFVQLGCYLDDLCLRPVDQLKKAGAMGRQQLRKEHKAGELPLAERIVAADPLAIILIGIGIEANVRRAVEESGCRDLPFFALPFPNWQRHVCRFHDGLTIALRELRKEAILP